MTTSQLRAFLRLVRTSEGATRMHAVATELRMNMTKLLPVLNAAEILGPVTVENGGAKLTNAEAEVPTSISSALKTSQRASWVCWFRS